MFSVLDKPLVNPYRPRVLDFPGMLFPWHDTEVEAQALLKMIQSYNGCLFEIGSGSGAHLIGLAQAFPDHAVIGVELRYKRAVRTVEKAIKANLTNLAVIRADTHDLFQVFTEKSINGIFVNFADPWEQRKRWKHRTMSLNLLDFCNRVLSPSGYLSVKTDHHPYFESFLADVEQHKSVRILEISRDLHNSEFTSNNIMTEFEQMFKLQKLPICYAKMSRIGV